MNSTYRQRGLTLMEVLVAQVVLSIGLLGVAALQTTGLRTQHSAHLHSQATLLAQDMLDRVRANPLGQTHYLGFDSASVTLTNPACIRSGCTPSQLAQHDLFQWQQHFTRTPAPALPNGRGQIIDDDDQLHVIVLWRSPYFETNQAHRCIDNQAAGVSCIQLSLRR